MLTGSDTHRDQDEADIFRVENLRIAARLPDQIGDRGLEQEEWIPQVAGNRAPPNFSDQVIVVDYAAVGLQLTT